MKTYVITEGPTDQRLLDGLLRAALPPGTFSVAQAGGKSSAVSLARSVLSVRSAPVVLVVDADTTDDSRIREQRVILTEELTAAAARARSAVVLAVPTIEICLFPTRPLAESVFQTRLSDAQWVRARFEPKAVATELLQSRNGRTTRLEDFVAHLPPRTFSLLKDGPVACEVREFITSEAATTAATS